MISLDENEQRLKYAVVSPDGHLSSDRGHIGLDPCGGLEKGFRSGTPGRVGILGK